MEGTIRTTSTSHRSADVDPVVLRETSTTRLLFRPTLVDNPKDQAAAVNGTLVHQRKKPSGAWEDYNEFPLSKLKDSEWVKLDLHASEVLKLFEELDALYAIAREHGVPRGEREFVPLEGNLRRLLQQPGLAGRALGDPELELVGFFVRWLDQNRGVAVERLREEVSDADLAAFDSLLAAVRLRQFNDEFHSNATNDSEDFWQDFFKTHSWVLARVYAHPFVLIQDQAYVGGKTITNTGGNLADFLYSNSLTGNVLIAEIKTPKTKLLGPRYRNRVYPPSNEVVGAITQVLTNRHSLIQQYKSLRDGGDDTWDPFSPRCLVVVGSLKREDMTDDQTASFELFRNQVRDVDLVTFDELAQQVDALVKFLTGETA
jgi:hypothetical protein